MPFKSEKQRKWMHANEPEMADKWEKEEESVNEGFTKYHIRLTKTPGWYGVWDKNGKQKFEGDRKFVMKHLKKLKTRMGNFQLKSLIDVATKRKGKDIEFDVVESVIKEAGMGILTTDQSDVLQGIVLRNKNKNLKAILKIVLKDPMFKGVDKKELLGYIDGARQFVKYMKSHPMESVNESSYHKKQITDFIKKNKDSEYTPTIQVKGSKSKTNYLNISFEALEQLAKIMMKESVNEAVVASMRTRSGQRDLEKKGGKLTMKMPNGEVLKFKDGADVKEYMDRVHGYWSFIKGYGKVKGLRESTAAYEKALQKIAKDKQMSMLSKKDRETLLKVAKLMKSANEACGPAEDEKIDEKVAMPLGQHLQAAEKELDYMIKVGPIEDAYDSPKASIKVIRMARKLLDKVN